MGIEIGKACVCFTVAPPPPHSDNPAVFPVEPVVYAPRDTTATLMVTVSSNPRPTEDNVVWYYRGSRIVPGQRHSFASTNQKLTIDDVEMGDYGEYTCEVNTTAGSDSATIILREPSKFGVLTFVHTYIRF